MIFIFVTDPREKIGFPDLRIPFDLGPNYISVMGSTVTDADIIASSASTLSLDVDGDELLAIDSESGDLFARFIKLKCLDEVIVVMPKRPFTDHGAKIMTGHGSEGHINNIIEKLKPTIRLSNQRSIGFGVNFLPSGTYTIEDVYGPGDISPSYAVSCLKDGVERNSGGLINLSDPGMYVLTIGGGELLSLSTETFIVDGFKYLICVE